MMLLCSAKAQRAVRQAGESDKRRKMREQLEKREKEVRRQQFSAADARLHAMLVSRRLLHYVLLNPRVVLCEDQGRQRVQ
jgi:hypothetical protein